MAEIVAVRTCGGAFAEAKDSQPRSRVEGEIRNTPELTKSVTIFRSAYSGNFFISSSLKMLAAYKAHCFLSTIDGESVSFQGNSGSYRRQQNSDFALESCVSG